MKSMRPGGSRSGKRIVKDLVGDTVLFDGSGPKSFASFLRAVYVVVQDFVG